VLLASASCFYASKLLLAIIEKIRLRRAGVQYAKVQYAVVQYAKAKNIEFQYNIKKIA